MQLSDPVRSVKGVGPVMGQQLAQLGIETVGDLIDHWPKRYDDFSRPAEIATIRPGMVVLCAEITDIKGRYVRRGMHLTEAYAVDHSGRVKLLWFNQPYRAAAIKGGQKYLISGTYDLSGRQLAMVNPSLEIASDVSAAGSGGVLGVYASTKGLNSAAWRKLIANCRPAFESITETLPQWLVDDQQLLSRSQAIEYLHLPRSPEDVAAAKRRLGFEELFQLQLANALTRAKMAVDRARPINFDQKLALDFTQHLPFKLTDDQRRTVWQIYQDMAKEVPMNRLVEGDVGSGKTVVAAMAAIMVLAAGQQVLMMAPTEILARQHAATLAELLAHTKWASQLGLLVGSLSSQAKTELHRQIAAGNCRLVVGTHALLQDKVITQDVGLVIVDEQHRFGVEQRQKLKIVGGLMPHVLTMTATPIPRTLALTLYGELDISVITTKPAGRQPIETKLIPFTARHSAYQQVETELAAGRQAFVVAPLISQSASLQTAAVEDLAKDLQTKQLPGQRVGLLHGRLKAADKDRLMQQFADHQLDVLVATTVIEVGVNIPNATIMVIEGAERFGLAQLHQLRGRVGRGLHQAHCLVIPSQDVPLGRRLQALASTTDGFRLSELDLQLRGPGAIYGTRQSGALDLRTADLSDRKMVQTAKQMAEEFLRRQERLSDYSWLASRVRHFQSVTHLN